MLVITRHEDEKTVFYDEDGLKLGTMTVTAIHGKRIQIGLDFRRGVTILRAEVLSPTDGGTIGGTITAAAPE